MHNPTHGLLHYAGYEEQERIRATLDVSFADLFDAINCVRENARVLQDDVKSVLGGERCSLSERRPQAV